MREIRSSCFFFLFPRPVPVRVDLHEECGSNYIKMQGLFCKTTNDGRPEAIPGLLVGKDINKVEINDGDVGKLFFFFFPG